MDTIPELSRDIWSVITGHINCGSDYKAICLINTTFLSIARMAHPAADTKFANQLTTLLAMIDRGDFLPRKFATKKEFFDFACRNGLSGNPNITIDYVHTTPNHPWNWEGLSRNPNITMDHVIANPGLPWDWKGLSQNPSITMDHVLANPDHPWDWYWVSRNSNITMDYVLANPDLPWDWEELSCNPNITMDHVLANPNRPWNWGGLSRNPNITWQNVIELDGRITWSWTGIVCNKFGR